jgi:brefeldin A-inhibited guanine nucleotide-exchange protein
VPGNAASDRTPQPSAGAAAAETGRAIEDADVEPEAAAEANGSGQAEANEHPDAPEAGAQASGGGAEGSGQTDAPATDKAPSAAPVIVETLVGPEPGPAAGDAGESVRFDDIWQVDGYLVFRALCKLSHKDGPGQPAAVAVTDGAGRPHEMRSKILALELLLVIMQNAGPAFQSHESFVSGVKQYLCPSLLRNGVSAVPAVFELALALYLCLLAGFKTHLKLQLEVFFKDIFLPVLETSASPLGHKWLVLQAILRICSDPQTLVDLYVNYDCDLNMSNVFESMVAIVSKVALGRAAEELGAGAEQGGQAETMRVVAIECLAQCCAAMAEWLGREEASSSSVRPASTDTLGDGAGANAAGRDRDRDRDRDEERDSMADDVMALKKRKEVVEEIVAAFNDKPRKGVQQAQKRGLVGPTPEHVAEWFKAEERLSKTAIGEYLGDSDPYCLQVMYAYVDSIDFADRDFVSALRLFLEGFRLPGEAQKIDRLMEKVCAAGFSCKHCCRIIPIMLGRGCALQFAARFCDNNPRYEVFENADTAYVLAYSIIMLTTDLHSPQVKKKMSLGMHAVARQVTSLMRGAPHIPLNAVNIMMVQTSLYATTGGSTTAKTCRARS